MIGLLPRTYYMVVMSCLHTYIRTSELFLNVIISKRLLFIYSEFQFSSDLCNTDFKIAKIK